MADELSMQKIDFVITWVDGNDPAWQKEKRKYLADYQNEELSIDQGEYRYRDWGILKYWFRAVEAYAPWVNRIHFVTCGQIPPWLNVDHPKLHLVDHKDYIPAEYLPTFNSHTIELNMHRIEGLAEQFVYFNDDTFITRPVSPEYFFKDGLPCDVFSMDAIYCASGSAGSYNCCDLEIINDHFHKKTQFQRHRGKWFRLRYGLRCLYRSFVFLPWAWFPGFYYQHLPNNFLKSTLEKVWSVAGEELHQTCLNKFRGKHQINQWVFKFWQLADGNFSPRSADSGHCYHLHDESVEPLCRAIRQKKYALICINDTDQTTDFEEKKAEITAAFDSVLGEKSSFER